jgi:dTDP-4-dehydrorhamnose 3,5-epimerase
MKIIDTPITDLLVIEPKVWKDDRGYFYESFRADFFKEINHELALVQDNQSLSQKGTIRGLHFQAPPFEQGKLVRVLQGSVLDVVVDIRKASPTYGQSFEIELNDQNHLQLWIPPGFAHGFSTLADQTIFCYKCSNYYHKASEGGIRFNDETLAIDWKVPAIHVSEKDYLLPTFKDFISPF